MGIFKTTVGYKMANSGTLSNPFLYAKETTETRTIGRIVWYRRFREKLMVPLSDEGKPYFVKTYESDTIRLIVFTVRNREQDWEYDKI